MSPPKRSTTSLSFTSRCREMIRELVLVRGASSESAIAEEAIRRMYFSEPLLWQTRAADAAIAALQSSAQAPFGGCVNAAEPTSWLLCLQGKEKMGRGWRQLKLATRVTRRPRLSRPQ